VKTWRMVLLGLEFVALPLLSRAQLSYVTNNNSITITGYNLSGGSVVVIPAMTNGYPVAGIGTNAFQGLGITSVSVPGSVAEIGNWAFFSCTSLTNLTLASGLTRIDDYSFMGCSSLPAITLPDTVTNLGIETFANCTGATQIDFGAGLSVIGDSEFLECSGLTNIILPANITSIGGFAFYNCTSLTNFTLGPGVTNLFGGNFINCPNLAAINADPANPAFTSVNGVLFNKNQTYLFNYPPARAGSYRIPASVTLIAGGAFESCAKLTAVTLPTGVTNINASAFSSCTSLTNVTIPASVTFLGGGAFGSCTNLRTVFFAGNPPGFGDVRPLPAFVNDQTNIIGYYLPSSTGWSTPYSGLPMALWNPQVQSGNLGVVAQKFTFTITGTAGLPLLIEASTNLVDNAWIPVGSLNLTNGAYVFTDPQWTNSPARFYRFRSP